MKIKNRIAFQFTLIVASILILFSVLVYSTSSTYREDEFYERLRDKSRTTCQLLTKVKEIDMNLLKIIDRNTITALRNEKVLIFDANSNLIYSSLDDIEVRYDPALLQEVQKDKEIRTHDGDNEVLAMLYDEGEYPVVVIASAFDEFGLSKLKNLRNTLSWSLLVGMGVTIGLSVYFAGAALRPIININEEVSTITAQNLQKRLNEGNRKDEIAQLSINFNKMLQRIELAFEQQRSFVSHASHELRTPLAALKSEIQLGEKQVVGDPDLLEVFRNLDSDTERLIKITNNLLLLARSFESVARITTMPLRMEDILFEVKEEVLSDFPDYSVSIDYIKLPETEKDTQVRGNRELLKVLLHNLIDNACKYSGDHLAKIGIDYDAGHCIVHISDSGIGIEHDDILSIFEPFYRADNATGYVGFGIGLSICKKIAEAHDGEVTVKSTIGKGSTFTIRLPNS